MTWQKGIIRRRGEAYDHRADSWLSGSLAQIFCSTVGDVIAPNGASRYGPNGPLFGRTDSTICVGRCNRPRFQILSVFFFGWMGA